MSRLNIFAVFAVLACIVLQSHANILSQPPLGAADVPTPTPTPPPTAEPKSEAAAATGAPAPAPAPAPASVTPAVVAEATPAVAPTEQQPDIVSLLTNIEQALQTGDIEEISREVAISRMKLQAFSPFNTNPADKLSIDPKEDIDEVQRTSIKLKVLEAELYGINVVFSNLDDLKKNVEIQNGIETPDDDSLREALKKLIELRSVSAERVGDLADTLADIIQTRQNDRDSRTKDAEYFEGSVYSGIRKDANDQLNTLNKLLHKFQRKLAEEEAIVQERLNKEKEEHEAWLKSEHEKDVEKHESELVKREGLANEKDKAQIDRENRWQRGMQRLLGRLLTTVGGGNDKCLGAEVDMLNDGFVGFTSQAACINTKRGRIQRSGDYHSWDCYTRSDNLLCEGSDAAGVTFTGDGSPSDKVWYVGFVSPFADHSGSSTPLGYSFGGELLTFVGSNVIALSNGKVGFVKNDFYTDDKEAFTLSVNSKGNTEFSKNGVVFYTSTETVKLPLAIEASALSPSTNIYKVEWVRRAD